MIINRKIHKTKGTFVFVWEEGGTGVSPFLMLRDRVGRLALADTTVLGRAQREPGTDQWQPNSQRFNCRSRKLMGRTGYIVCGAQYKMKMQGPLLKNY